MSEIEETYTILVLMTATKEWLSLSREERNRFNEEVINPIVGRYADSVRVRLFDAEAFSARCSDFAIFETPVLKDYYFLMEELRDTALFTQPYMIMNDVIMGIEGGFQMFEAAQREAWAL